MSYRHFKGDPNKLYLVNTDSIIRTSDKDGIIIGYKGIGEEIVPEGVAQLLRTYNYDSVFNIRQKLLEDLPHLLYLCILESHYVDFEEITEENGIIKNNNT